MMHILVDAALRSLVVGLVVAIGLRIFRVQNVFARKAALGLVLVGALSMPFLMPVADRLPIPAPNPSLALPAQAMTLLEELQAKLLAKSGAGMGAKAMEMPAPERASSKPASAPKPRTGAAPLSQEPGWPATEPDSSRAKSSVRSVQPGGLGPQSPRSAPFGLSRSALFLVLYFGVAGLLLLRMALGLAVTARLWRNATPIPGRELPGIPASVHVRASRGIRSPLTVGSGILLPADYSTWDREKRQIVLAHERSHIRQGDFYLQLLAGVYAAVAWFSPLGWWLKRELADLAEAISDHAGMEHAQSRTSYAQVLLEFAAAPRPAAMGVAMARSGSLARRIERLLNEQVFRQSFAGSRRTLCAVVLLPAVLFVGTAMVRVEAATDARARVGMAAPASAADGPAAKPAAARYMADSSQAADGAGLHASASVLVAVNPDAGEIEMESLEASEEIAAGQAAPNLLHVAAMVPVAAGQADTRDALSFDRTFQVGGAAQLLVTTGSGDITIKRGSGNQIHIHGRVHVSENGSDEQGRQIAANPPIEQSGDVVRVGQEHEHHWHGISINYEIEAPAATLLAATSGSGNIADDGVGRDAKLETGSGDIHAKGLEGSFVVKTGSGEITADGTGQGDVKAETGSGNIEIRNIHGSFRGQTGSGDIKATGTPSAPWTLQTGSGNVEVWTGNAPLTLDASTGSGSFSTDHEMLMKGSFNQHHVTGNLNGGGPLVKVQTGSGDVSVH